jgi:hypothetical protein
LGGGGGGIGNENLLGATNKDDNIRIMMKMKKSNKKGGNDL